MQWKLRRSQFVLTWGPGSILEGGPHGSRLILRPDIGLFYQGNPHDLKPSNFAIGGKRISLLLHALSPSDEIRVFRLPSNAELGRPDSKSLYSTLPFPRWRLCRNHDKHGNRGTILYRAGGGSAPQNFRCPVCGNDRFSEPVRFVMACPDGHLDDVDWHRVAHHGRSCARGWNDHLLWKGGGTLSQIRIECPGCGQSASLGWAYGENWRCSGWFPERDPSRGNLSDCSSPARILLRQASYLRIPEVRALFTIPPLHRELHALVEKYRDLVETLDESVREDEISPEKAKERLCKRYPVFRPYTWDEIQEALQDLESEEKRSIRPGDFLLDEFRTFLQGAAEGIPRQKIRDSLIEMLPARSAEYRYGRTAFRFRVSQIPTLQTVTVQIGYRREIPGAAHGGAGSPSFGSRLVDVSFADGRVRWYPGVAHTGEGIFVTMEGDGWITWDSQNGENVPEWFRAFREPEKYRVAQAIRQELFEQNVLHPAFVWWHTLSHALIRAIATESGYPAASIRERVYVEVDKKKPERARGGVILYTVQPGADGTLGGLISLVPRFELILQRAFELLDSCSLDPICEDTRFTAGRHSGAACYACQFLSETSCEHRNMWLDRGVIREHP